MNIKGLTSIPKPLEGIASRTAPRGQQEIVSEIASLYRQEVRLEKKLLLWERNQQQAERDLRRVQKRRAFLEGLRDRRGTDRPSSSAERKSGHTDGHKAATGREIPQPSPELEPESEPWDRQPPITLERQRVGRRATR